MKLFVSLCVWAAGSIILAVALFSVANSWLDKPEGVFPLGRSLVFETRRTEALQNRMEMIVRNGEIKRAAIAELLAGRLTLCETADQFQEANRMIGNTDPKLVADYQAPTTEAGLCRQVIAWVKSETAILSPEQAKRILAPLVQEYESMFGPLESAEEFPTLIEI